MMCKKMTTQKEDDLVVNDIEKWNLKKTQKKIIIKIDAKKVLIGAGARIFFYPTLLYNVLRYKIESDFRWWDQVDQFLLLGAVPFPKDVERLKQLGVGGVITLNEPFETLVPSSMYKAHEMEHLIVPIRDYLYAPSFDDINRAVDFIHHNAACGRATYVHCKAGRGRSTTVALCYMVKYKQMTPSTAMEVIRAKRPRVLLTSMQAKAVQQYYSTCFPDTGHSPSSNEVLVTLADLEGYKETSDDTSRTKEVFIPKAVATSLSSLLSSLTIACSCVSIRTQQPKQTAC
ncbi:putative dual specificity protein phosphatase DSP8 isoform X1 [Chenopodium quinoa]|uniref:putative dual specificity protein phosphatase DSP8 isoform X1 n=1 Tax=Chenopodium quinoa TaxID=63459 RepID=UPI000B794DDE|nr:putative dual specificity protein phosphatase DSP8 isoform X1 [Chenopodium quinoa]